MTHKCPRLSFIPSPSLSLSLSLSLSFLWAGMLSLIWGVCLFPVPVRTCSVSSVSGGLAGVLLCFSIGICVNYTRGSLRDFNIWMPEDCVLSFVFLPHLNKKISQDWMRLTLNVLRKNMLEEHQGLIDNPKCFLWWHWRKVWSSLDHKSRCLQRCQCVSAVTPSRSHIWDIFPKKQVVFLQIPLTFPTYFVGLGERRCSSG